MSSAAAPRKDLLVAAFACALLPVAGSGVVLGLWSLLAPASHEGPHFWYLQVAAVPALWTLIAVPLGMYFAWRFRKSVPSNQEIGAWESRLRLARRLLLGNLAFLAIFVGVLVWFLIVVWDRS